VVVDRVACNAAVTDFCREFEENFPGEDPLRAASLYCNTVLQSKMQGLLKQCFEFRSPAELIAILECIDAQAKKSAEGRRPGRPRKLRDGDRAAVQPDPSLAPQE
jgi:hypothetical protein